MCPHTHLKQALLISSQMAEFAELPATVITAIWAGSNGS